VATRLMIDWRRQQHAAHHELPAWSRPWGRAPVSLLLPLVAHWHLRWLGGMACCGLLPLVAHQHLLGVLGRIGLGVWRRLPGLDRWWC